MLSSDLPRFDRTLAMLVMLQTRRVVKAQEMADRFGVSLRTIYRDVKSLEAAGVPIIGEAGTGYSIMDGYRLPPVMFTREEAGSFVAAEKLMQKFTDAGMGRYFESAMNKVKAVLKGNEKDWVAALEKQVWMEPGNELFNKEVPNALEILFTGIAEQKQIFIEYRSLSSTASEHRSIEPIGIFHEGNHWYLYAWCHLRNDYRQFRTDRILYIRNTEVPFAKQHGSIDELREKEKSSCEPVRVVLSVDRSILRYINSGKHYYGFVSQEEKEDEVEMVFLTDPTMEGIARWFMMFGDQARILEPEPLKQKVKQMAEEISANINA